jgi:hypothetical protein
MGLFIQKMYWFFWVDSIRIKKRNNFLEDFFFKFEPVYVEKTHFRGKQKELSLLLVKILIFQLSFLEETRICIKNTFFKEKLFTIEVQGILKGAWLVRRL